jgi:hypothetical protein
MNLRPYLFVSGLLLFTGIPLSITQAAEMSGKYSYSITDFISFEGGQFEEQYITTEYGTPALSDDTEDSSGASPVIEAETVCLAKGSYATTSAGFSLEYQSDSCEFRQGSKTAAYDAESDVVTLDSKIYRKESTGSQEDGEGTAEAIASRISASDITAGLKTWQSNVAQAMQNLNNTQGGIWYCSGNSPHLDASYWTWSSNTGSGGWIPNTSAVAPSDAVNWYFGTVAPSDGCTECLMASRASFYKGLLDTVGKTTFDSWFKDRSADLVISNRGYAPSSTRVNKPINSENDLARGDWVYFQNWVSSRGCPAIDPLQGENAITQNSASPKTYIGLGMPARYGDPVVGEVILSGLRSAWERTGCAQEREGQLRKDIAMTASPAYFEQLASNLSILQTLQYGASVSVSGSVGSKQFYKLVIPSGTSSIQVSTSGGSGNSDLYLMRNQWPSKTQYDHKSNSATNDETVQISNPVGVWYIMLDGASDYSNMTLVANTTSTGGGGITIDGQFSDWEGRTTFSDATDDGNTVNWDSVWVDDGNAQFSFSYTNVQAINESQINLRNIYLDTDNKIETGYGFSVLGAEYLVQGKSLYQYTGSGQDWSWKYQGEVSYAISGSRAELAIPKASLGLPADASHYHALFYGADLDGSNLDYLLIDVNNGGGVVVMEEEIAAPAGG